MWTQETVPHCRGFVFAPGVRPRLACQIRTKLFPMLSKLRQSLQERTAQRKRRKIEQTKQSKGRPQGDGTGQSHPQG
jgi:hypothetical protein